MVEQEVAEGFQPYRRMIRAQVRAQMSYRSSFVADLIGSAVVTSFDLVTVIVFFSVTKTLGGFPFRVSLLIAALAGLGFALADLFVGNIEKLRDGIRSGQLDAMLVRPLGLLRQLLAADFQMRQFGRVTESMVALGIATGLAHVRWSGPILVLYLMTPLVGAVFFASIFVLGGTVAFWWIDSSEFASGFTYGGRDFTSYPVTVYGSFFRHVFAFGLGFAFVAYYPALVILRIRDPLGLPGWLGWLSPVFAAAMAGIAVLFWRTGVRHYRSTGS